MEYIRVTKDNIEKEHDCCAISNNMDVQVSSKKALQFFSSMYLLMTVCDRQPEREKNA